MPARVAPGDESGAQVLLADTMPSCSSVDVKSQAVRASDGWNHRSTQIFQELILEKGIPTIDMCLSCVRRWWGYAQQCD